MKHGKKGRAARLKDTEKKAAGLEYELGRWKKAVATRNKIIDQLTEDLKAEHRKQVSNEALVALLLKRLGATEENPVVIEHEAMRKAVSNSRVLIALDIEKETYALHVEACEGDA